VSVFSVCAHVKERFLTLFWYISMPELMSDDVTTNDDDKIFILASLTIIFSIVVHCYNGSLINVNDILGR